MTAILTFDDVGLSLGGRRVLDGLGLSVERGRHLLVLGPSGSGKTSLLHLAGGLRTADAGTVALDGEPWPRDERGRDRMRRARVGIIFQTLQLIPALTLGANLALAARLAGRDGAAIPRLLDRLGLGTLSSRSPRTLSQGEAQRAAIARALAAQPALLLADEPTSALDDRNAEAVARLLKEEADASASTLVIATHDARLKDHFPNVLTLEGAR